MTQQELFKVFESLPTEAQRQALNFIAFLHQTYVPEIKPQKTEIDWTNDPFIGMWQERQEMDDNSRRDRTMDRVEHYRQIVRTFLEAYAQESVSPNETVTAELVFDEKRDRYLLVHVGWQGARRIYGCPMQIDIIDNKVWLQHNATEIFVDQELIAKGIPEDDVVLGLQSPRIRKLVAAKKSNSTSQPLQNEYTNSP
jgi:hypothetical protein